ncbi:uncharacterized protein [Parasteatoda tepidariorum]|nr:uncharacterized protein LOC107443113 isoform X1 [Parasteatoda tepidariorum]XP_042899773.1 uncharacterized protein LOC107443113 isoform X1 [Parasteatoda tepidariorum]XP_042899774.1 uncharacterized protein LOC107443113 isoform X2 [Parasteatoda tepidariorum]
MTSILKASSIFVLFFTFIWHINTETTLSTYSDAEEEEEKMANVLFGNGSSVDSITLPPTDDSSSSLVLDDDTDSKKEHVWWENDTNSTDYDELNDEKKNDASPENSVDRDLLEKVNYFLPDQPVSDTFVFTDFKRESSSQTKSVLLSYETYTSSMPDMTTSLSCGFGDRKCNMLGEDSPSDLNSKANEEQLQPTVETFHPTSSVKLLLPSKLVEETSSEILNFTSDIEFLSDYLTSTPANSATAQTSENLILEENTDRIKDEIVIQGLTNKSDKSKQVTKERESPSTMTDDLPVRTFSKTSENTPSMPTKELISPWNAPSGESILFSKIFSTSSSPLSSPVPDKTADTSTTDSYFSLKTNTYIFPELESKKKEETDLNDDVKTSSISPTSLLSSFSTISWHYSKSDMTIQDDKFSRKEKVLDTTSVLTSSFSPTPVLTETENFFRLKSSFSQTQQKQQISLESSSISESTAKPSVLSSQSIITNLHTDTFTTIVPLTREKETVPPPRLTNPGCSSLPVCVEITLLETNWEHFCSQQQDFLEFLSTSLSHYTRPIHPYHIVLDTEVCTLSSNLRSSQNSPDVTVAFYVTNESGEYEERMTELCGVILRKWAPSAFKSSVIEVRMYSRESISTPLPIIPELNSGFVAAVSISAVAGVALCLLCILLVIMKQKLIQGRHSDATTPTAADAYSLDSLSISASFRRRRIRRSARSYLNHAFTDQEIPSHPLNEKTLANSLKSKDLLEEEYKRLPMNMPKLDSIPEGAHVKNRYSNILPKAESRVMLADPSGDPLKCYINANYVKGYEGKSSFYIACQAPLPEGIEDFWRMIWEQQCRVIVMLTMFEENGTSRCAVYFPQSTLISQQPYGDFQVSLLKKDVYEFYTLSTLRLLDLEKNLFRDVVHLWFTGWPDVGVPKDSSSLVTFVQQCRPFINCNSGPTVVHCSTGTGRTGVFIALDICMREYDQSRSIDILQCISQIRKDRSGAVQNKDQYILIHDAMLEYISRVINQSQRPSISS